MTSASSPLVWIHDVAAVPDTGLAVHREASEAERSALVADLPVLSILRLMADYQIASAGGGRYRLTGDLDVEATQQCVVSLESVPAHVEETFSIEFWPPDLIPQSSGEQDVLVATDIEPLESGIIDVGRIVFELLSAGLDPYPRKADAEFQWQDPKGGDPETDGPFAVLAKLKKKD
jgi:uncharacterized metal-binding protein YceD (DUF177 family)